MFNNGLKKIILFVCAIITLTFAQKNNPTPYNIPSAQDSIWDSPSEIDPAVRENDAGRYALPHRELMQRTYDVSGQKSELVLGTSILGRPDLEPFSMGIGSVTSRYPSMLSGIYTTRLGYDETTLNLNGDNGILFEERHGIPIDTPITDIDWERAAFTGNALRLDFRRLLTDSVMLDFGIQSRSNKESKEYEYQGVTHSPYFALGRDSTSIPFAGRNIAVNSMHIQPMLIWRFGFGKAFAKINFLSLENADNKTHKVILDSIDYSIRKFQTSPYTIDISAATYGGGIEVYPTKRITVGTSIHYGSHDIELDSMGNLLKEIKNYTDTLGVNRTDSIYHDTTHIYSYETILGNGYIRLASLLNPTLKFEYEFLNTDNTIDYNRKNERIQKYEQDREVGYLQLEDTLSIFLFRTQLGMQRNSSLFDKQEYLKAYSFDLTMLLPYHFRLNGTYRHDNKFPDVSQQKFTESGRFTFPNEELKTEIRDRYTANIGWFTREVYYGIGLRKEEADNLIKRQFVKQFDSLSVENNFKWTNIKYVESLDWLFQLGFRLGNWKFFLERGETIERNKKLIDTQELYYKGSIHYQNRFVKNRLGFSVRVDWQWFDYRYDCTINENGVLELEHLKNYLAMDFEARMQILSFELYNRIENFNHSIYMPASGYTPEGLRFSYGIVWTFKN